MSGKQFFVNRYKQLGWDFKEVKTQASHPSEHHER
jgi:hypothetical protein